MAMQMVTIPYDMIRERKGHKHMDYYLLIQQRPNVSYEDAARELGVTVKHVKKIEDDLIDDRYLKVARVRVPAKGEVIEREMLDRLEQRLPLEMAS